MLQLLLVLLETDVSLSLVDATLCLHAVPLPLTHFKALPVHYSSCMPETSPTWGELHAANSVPKFTWWLIIPLFFFLTQPEKSQPLFLSYLDRMLELTKNILYLLINGAQVGLSKVSHLTQTHHYYEHSSLHSHYSPVFHTSIDCIYSLYY